MGNQIGRSRVLGGVLVLAAVLGLASPAAANGTLAWGDNESGDIGNNSAYEQRLPVLVHVLPSSIVGVAAGGAHSLAFSSGGSLWAWGDNEAGQVGNNTVTDRYEPVQVSGIAGVVEASGGQLHSLARKSNGTVWAWGDNSHGQLGDKTTTDRLKPVQVHAVGLMVAIAAGGSHSLALESDGTVWAWGLNDRGQLGDGSAIDQHEPGQVHTVSGVVAIAGGSSHSLAAQKDGTVWAWGGNSNGQLGDDSTTDRPEPVQVHNLTDVVAVAAGGGHSLALKGDGTVWAWGENLFGQLGDGSASDRHEPVQVRYLTNITAIAAGDSFSLALRSDGTVWAWGYNGYGQVGDSSIVSRLEPVQVTTLTTFVAIAAGGAHALAVTGTGLPDLLGCGCNAPRSAYWGQPIPVTCQHLNAGPANAGSFRVQWYLSQNPTGGADAIPLIRTNGQTYYAHNAIAAKTTGPAYSVTLQLPAALPSGWSGTRFYVIMATDSLNAVAESNEANNFGQMGDGLDRDPILIGTAVPEVTYPTPDEVWLRGTSYTINWRAFLSTNVRIELYKSGVLNRTLTSSMSNTGSLAWTVPTSQAIGDDYTIKVTAPGNAAITDTTGTFTIAEPKIGYPTAAGVAWLGDKTYPIMWSGFPDATVNVDLYKAGVLAQSLATDAPNAPDGGSVNWKVPLGQAVGTDYTVVVSSPTNPMLSATSGQPFTIAVPKVTSPAGPGVVWRGGSSSTIAWSGFSGTNVKINLYKGTSLSRTIAKSTSNVGSLLWVVPTSQTPGFDYTLQVVSTANSLVISNSDPFAIATPKVTYPTAAGVSIQAGKVMTIKWSGYPGTTVKIETYQGGAVADTPSPSTANDGNFAYTVPKTLTPGPGYSIKITSTVDGTISNPSDNSFTITP